MTLQYIKLQPLWVRQFQKSVYSCIIANLLGDPDPEIIGCSFSAEMKAFDLKGNEVFITEFSSSITSFKIASVSKQNNIELISGALDGTIYVMDKNGNSIWSTSLNSPVICMETGDIRDDSRDEIIVGLENQRLIGLDNEGKKFLEFKAPEPIMDCTIGYFSDGITKKIFILLKSGKILNILNDIDSELVFDLQYQPTCLTFSNIFNQPTLIVGDKSGFLKALNLNKEIIGNHKLGEKVQCLDTYTIFTEQKENTYLVAASKNKITFFQIVKGEKIDIIEIPTPKAQPHVLTTERINETLDTPLDNITSDLPSIPDASAVEPHDIRVLRGGQIEGGEYHFKVKVINNRNYNVTNVNINILSYPEESLILSRIDSHPEFSPDNAKFHKISKGGGFVSPTFVFKPKKDCIKGTVHAVVNFINEKDQIDTINVEPHEIRMICGLLKPKTVSKEDFENLTKDLLAYKKVGQEFTLPYNVDQLYQKLALLLKRKNFAIIDTEKKESEGKLQIIIKGFAEGTFSKHSVGLLLALSGSKGEQLSVLKVDVFAEDEDMTPSIMSELENSVNPQSCPECQEKLPLELVRKILGGLPVFCEECGSKLIEIDGEITASPDNS
ncbi:MAG: hypothetical protein EAX91_11885 [Candidatus Lokiarchaeota archaeon]|nr:hypothetical protein [Candidatus Lokiarchaeota archaeon]